MRSMSWTKNLNGMPIGIWTWIKNDSWPEEIISWKFISFFYFQEPWWNRFAAWRRWRFSQLTLIRRAKLWLTTKLSARNGTATFAKPLLCLRCSLSVVLCPSIVAVTWCVGLSRCHCAICAVNVQLFHCLPFWLWRNWRNYDAIQFSV